MPVKCSTSEQTCNHKTEQTAAANISNWWKKISSKNRPQESENKSALVIQSCWRRRKVRKASYSSSLKSEIMLRLENKIEIAQSEHDAAITLQKQARRAIASRVTHGLRVVRWNDQFEQENKAADIEKSLAAIFIQMSWRGYSSRKVVASMRREQEFQHTLSTSQHLIIRIQAVGRAYFSKKKVSKIPKKQSAKKRLTTRPIKAWDATSQQNQKRTRQPISVADRKGINSKSSDRAMSRREPKASGKKSTTLPRVAKRHKAAVTIQQFVRFASAKSLRCKKEKQHALHHSNSLKIQLSWKQHVSSNISKSLRSKRSEQFAVECEQGDICERAFAARILQQWYRNIALSVTQTHTSEMASVAAGGDGRGNVMSGRRRPLTDVSMASGASSKPSRRHSSPVVRKSPVAQQPRRKSHVPRSVVTLNKQTVDQPPSSDKTSQQLEPAQPASESEQPPSQTPVAEPQSDEQHQLTEEDQLPSTQEGEQSAPEEQPTEEQPSEAPITTEEGQLEQPEEPVPRDEEEHSTEQLTEEQISEELSAEQEELSEEPERQPSEEEEVKQPSVESGEEQLSKEQSDPQQSSDEQVVREEEEPSTETTPEAGEKEIPPTEQPSEELPTEEQPSEAPITTEEGDLSPEQPEEPSEEPPVPKEEEISAEQPTEEQLSEELPVEQEEPSVEQPSEEQPIEEHLSEEQIEEHPSETPIVTEEEEPVSRQEELPAGQLTGEQLSEELPAEQEEPSVEQPSEEQPIEEHPSETPIVTEEDEPAARQEEELPTEQLTEEQPSEAPIATEGEPEQPEEPSERPLSREEPSTEQLTEKQPAEKPEEQPSELIAEQPSASAPEEQPAQSSENPTVEESAASEQEPPSSEEQKQIKAVAAVGKAAGKKGTGVLIASGRNSASPSPSPSPTNANSRQVQRTRQQLTSRNSSAQRKAASKATSKAASKPTTKKATRQPLNTGRTSTSAAAIAARKPVKPLQTDDSEKQPEASHQHVEETPEADEQPENKVEQQDKQNTEQVETKSASGDEKNEAKEVPEKSVIEADEAQQPHEQSGEHVATESPTEQEEDVTTSETNQNETVSQQEEERSNQPKTTNEILTESIDQVDEHHVTQDAVPEVEPHQEVKASQKVAVKPTPKRKPSQKRSVKPSQKKSSKPPQQVAAEPEPQVSSSQPHPVASVDTHEPLQEEQPTPPTAAEMRETELASKVIQRLWRRIEARKTRQGLEREISQQQAVQEENHIAEMRDDCARKIQHWHRDILAKRERRKAKKSKNVPPPLDQNSSIKRASSKGSSPRSINSGKRLDSPQTIERRAREAAEEEATIRKEESRILRETNRKKRQNLSKQREERKLHSAREIVEERERKMQEQQAEFEDIRQRRMTEEQERQERTNARLHDEDRRERKRKAARERKLREIAEMEEHLSERRQQIAAELEEKKQADHERRLQAMQERSKETELRLHLGNHALREVLKHKPLHLVMEEKACARERAEEENRRQKLQERKECLKPRDFLSEVANHEEHYLKHKGEHQSPDYTGQWKRQAPSYYIGKSHELVSQEMKHERNERLEQLRVKEGRRKRMHNFAELVKVMYPPKTRPQTESGPGRQQLPPIPPRCSSTEPPAPAAPRERELEMRRKGNQYMRMGNEKARLHPKKKEPVEVEPAFLKPLRCERDRMGDKYLAAAKKFCKTPSPKKDLTDEERLRELKDLRKKARLTSDIPPLHTATTAGGVVCVISIIIESLLVD